jgi:hypothetical protein
MFVIQRESFEDRESGFTEAIAVREDEKVAREYLQGIIAQRVVAGGRQDDENEVYFSDHTEIYWVDRVDDVG